jgi:hypothetical protein
MERQWRRPAEKHEVSRTGLDRTGLDSSVLLAFA